METAIALAKQKHPKLVASLAEDLPTGRKKHLFKIPLSAKHDPQSGIQKFCPNLTLLQEETTHSFRGLLKKSLTSPPSTFKSWWHWNQNDHLSEGKKILLRNIIRDRWASYSPHDCVRNQIYFRDYDLVESFEEWLKTDPQQAIKFASTREKKHQDDYEKTAGQLFIALAKDDLQKAFTFHRNLSELSAPTSYHDHWIAPFTAAAKIDREAFLDLAPKDVTWKEASVAAIMHAWLAEDFDWTMQTLKNLEVGPEILHTGLLEALQSAKPFTANFHLLSPEWQQAIAGRPYLYRGIEMELLTNKYPQIPPKILTQTREHMTYQCFWGARRERNRKTLIELIHNGTWLSDQTRTNLTECLLIGYYPHTAEAQKFLDTIPPKFRGKKDQRFIEWPGIEHSHETGMRNYGPKKFIEFLQSQPIEPNDFGVTPWTRADELKKYRFTSWTDSDFEAVESELQAITPEIAGKIYVALSGGYATPVGLSLFKKCCQDAQSADRYLHFRTSVDFAKKMAKKNCPATATWAESLPPSRTKDRIISETYYLWSHYNKGEALAWAQTLPKEARHLLGVK